MGDIAIQAANLSKRYALNGSRHDSFKDLVAHALQGRFGRKPSGGERNSFWALQDASFEVKQGEVVGIIGQNGAGKSTLLKVLARITRPTGGRAVIYGRMSSLLEVGTGFHPELSGRDNIYLSGTILGMKKTEIDSKFDEIVAFAEIEKFLDTPVKHYSSGMYVRLAFAVAAHLEPEILIIDEVLAVGDARFQKKCLNKMQDVGKHGRTVLFVSHSMPAITRLCERAILLHEGRVVHDGPSHEVVRTYLGSGFGSSAHRQWSDPSKAPGGDVARLSAVRVMGGDGRTTDAVDIRRPFKIEMEYEVLKSGYVLSPHYHLVNDAGELIFITQDLDPQWRRRPRPTGLYRSYVEIPENLLTEGTVFVGCYCITLSPDTLQFSAPDVVAFQVIDSLDGDSARGDYTGPMPGVVRPLLKWSTTLDPSLTPG